MISEFLERLPSLPISPEIAVILSTLIVSLGAGLGALILNRRAITQPVDESAEMGAVLENPAGLIPHLSELRTRLVHSLVGIVLATGVASLLTEQFLRVLTQPIGGLGAIQAIRVTESISVFFRLALTAGIILAAPYVISQLWIFIAAGLKPAERRWFYLLFPFALILFFSGVAFAYGVMLPAAVPFLVSFMGISAIPTLDDYVQFVTSVLLWVGISFELPLVIFLLAKAKLVTAAALARHWRIAIVGIAILAAVVTPTGDPVNMGIVILPLIVLYLLSILLALLA